MACLHNSRQGLHRTVLAPLALWRPPGMIAGVNGHLLTVLFHCCDEMGGWEGGGGGAGGTLPRGIGGEGGWLYIVLTLTLYCFSSTIVGFFW